MLLLGLGGEFNPDDNACCHVHLLDKPLNGKISFGYQWKDNKIIPHPQEAPIRKLIYDLYLEHRRKKTVARILNERGYRTRDGKPFSDTSVQYLIRDPTAKGLHRANYTTKNGAGNLRVVKPESEWVWTRVEPIVSEETWDKCNQILTDYTSKHKRPGKKPKNLFSGIAHCTCGKKMYVRSNTPKYVCTTCWNNIPIVDLEAIYYEELKGYFLSPAKISEHLTRADQALTEKQGLLNAMEAEDRKLREEIERVYRLYVDQKLDGEGFAKFYRPLEQRQKQIGEELPNLQADIDISTISHVSAEQVIAEAKDLYTRWPTLDREEKQRIVESITHRITIGKGEVEIILYGLPTSEELVKEQSKLYHPAHVYRRTSGAFCGCGGGCADCRGARGIGVH